MLLVLFLFLMIIGVPIAVSLGISTVFALLLFTDIPLSLISQSMYSSMNSFIMVAVPLFILAGMIMDEGGIAERIFNFAKSLVGWLTGGLGHVSIVANVIFAGMAGSSVAEVASIGNISIKAMTKNKYPQEYATALSLASSMLATIIPPSILMVIAASVANVSIGKALIGGLIPGVIIAALFMAFNYVYSRKKGYGERIKFSFGELRSSFIQAIPALLVPVILLGGILSGYFTPTESAAVAVLYSLAISLFLYKTIKLRQLPRLFFQTAKVTGTILFIAVTAKPAGLIFEMDGLPSRVGSFIGSLSDQPIVIMLLLLVFYILVGMFMDATAAIFILVPILLPTVTGLGIDPVFFIVFTVIILSFGLITPPVGVCLYAACNITGLSLEKVTRSAVPWMAVTILIMIIFAIFPGVITGPISWFGL
ncbi:TRAP transporter large permease [uncultured Paenibacillus sp.]|uniref:TRAP transporter large permease n=1 Tax=uncultured Paenibacillus sp. TaxID=227322 RepID=UPI0028D5C9A0|nr:TRAP transporter large permease [uncultured Paenibacillus sp.]